MSLMVRGHGFTFTKRVCVCGRGGGVGEEHGIRGYYENKLNLIY